MRTSVRPLNREAAFFLRSDSAEPAEGGIIQSPRPAEIVMSDLFAAVKAAFGEMEWAFREVEGREVVEADFEAYHTKVSLHAQVFSEINALAVVSQAPLSGGSPALLRAVAELLMRTNQTLTIGGFEMNWDTREVIFRVSNLFAPGHYDRRVIAELVHTTVAEMDRAAPFVSVLQKTPVERLDGFDIKELLAREDLLPAVEDKTT